MSMAAEVSWPVLLDAVFARASEVQHFFQRRKCVAWSAKPVMTAAPQMR